MTATSDRTPGRAAVIADLEAVIQHALDEIHRQRERLDTGVENPLAVIRMVAECVELVDDLARFIADLRDLPEPEPAEPTPEPAPRRNALVDDETPAAECWGSIG